MSNGPAGDAGRAGTVELPGGLELRPATAHDSEAIIDLSVAAHGEPERWGITALLADPTVGPSRFTVVTDGDRVVSTLGLMSRTVVVRAGDVEVALPCGQPEYVATEPEHRRKRLVRHQLDVVHGWSAARGDVVQIIVGIPYFYRRFGYETALAFPMADVSPDLEVPAGFRVRPATSDDVDAIVALDATDSARADVAVPLRRETWERYVTGGEDCNYETWVAETTAGSAVEAAGLLADWGEAVVYAGMISASTPESATAVLARMTERAAPRRLRAWHRSRTGVGAALAAAGRPAGDFSIYVRVPDPVALLDRLRPVLDARLASGAWSGWSGEAVLSLYERGIRMVVDDGRVAEVEEVAGHHDPTEAGQAACPPDLVATLIFGRYGALDLEGRADDVDLGRHRDLVATLFPAQVHDFATEI